MAKVGFPSQRAHANEMTRSTRAFVEVKGAPRKPGPQVSFGTWLAPGLRCRAWSRLFLGQRWANLQARLLAL